MAEAPIDAVITWVDGDDPAHAARRSEWAGQVVAGGEATRFVARDELRFCILSILRHAPFVRRIHVVTDRQVPPVLAELAAVAGPDRIRLVDHAEIFRGHAALLPVFNSIAIEAMVHRIEGLAERFVMFNDDIFLTADITPQDWFSGDGVVLRGRWFGRGLDVLAGLRRLLRPLPGIGPVAARFSNKEAYRRGAVAAGVMGRCFVLGHAPYPGLVSGYARLMAAQPAAYLGNAAHRFRSAEQFNVVSLFAHDRIAAGAAVLKGEADLVYLRADRDSAERVREKIARVDAGAGRFLCIQSLDQASPEVAGFLGAWLAARFPTPPHPDRAEAAPR